MNEWMVVVRCGERRMEVKVILMGRGTESQWCEVMREGIDSLLVLFFFWNILRSMRNESFEMLFPKCMIVFCQLRLHA